MTEFTYTYKDSDHNTLHGAPTDAGSYTVTISVPSENKYFNGEKTLSFTISKKKVTAVPRDQAVIQDGSISSSFVSYSGFCGSDNAENCISNEDTEKPVVKLVSGIGTAAAGKYPDAISISEEGCSTGKLTDKAGKNYELAAATSLTPKGTLTVLAKQAESDGSGSSVPLGNGEVRTAVITDENVKQELDPTLESNLTTEKATGLLSDSEKESVEDGGENALIYLELTKAGDDVQDDKDNIAQKAETVDESVYTGDIEYLELSLYKKVGDSTPEKITNTEGTKITVTVKLTGNLLNSDSDNTVRTYRIVYEHDGQTKIIVPSINGDTLTFTTGEFSTYGIVFFDKVKSTPPTPTPGDGDDSGNHSGDNSGDKDTGGNGSGSDASDESSADTAQKTDKKTDTKVPAAPLTPDTGSAADSGTDVKESGSSKDNTKGKAGSKGDAAGSESGSKDSSKDDIGQKDENGTDSTTADNKGSDEKNTEHVGDDGQHDTKDGTPAKVSTDHCFWHFIILFLGIAGALIVYMLRRKREKGRAAGTAFAVDTVLMVICMLIGWCIWDKVMLILGATAMAGSYYIGGHSSDKESAAER